MNQLYRLRAFPKAIEGGNKAGVYLFADDLSKDDMQNIAKEVGYSETAFVLDSDVADFRVRFFTPTSEVDLCGHATIATFNLLRDLKIIQEGIYTQETKAGILELSIESQRVFMEQHKPYFDHLVEIDALVECFDGLEFSPILKPQIVSTGLREIFLPVKNIEVLNQIKPNFNQIIKTSRKFHVIGIHAFALDKTVDAYGRNFAPALGINEESATGTSNGALACYLYQHLVQKNEFILRQGYSMNQPSEVLTRLNIKDKQIDRVWVGGSATIIKE